MRAHIQLKQFPKLDSKGTIDTNMVDVDINGLYTKFEQAMISTGGTCGSANSQSIFIQ